MDCDTVSEGSIEVPELSPEGAQRVDEWTQATTRLTQSEINLNFGRYYDSVRSVSTLNSHSEDSETLVGTPRASTPTLPAPIMDPLLLGGEGLLREVESRLHYTFGRPQQAVGNVLAACDQRVKDDGGLARVGVVGANAFAIIIMHLNKTFTPAAEKQQTQERFGKSGLQQAAQRIGFDKSIVITKEAAITPIMASRVFQGVLGAIVLDCRGDTTGEARLERFLRRWNLLV